MNWLKMIDEAIKAGGVFMSPEILMALRAELLKGKKS